MQLLGALCIISQEIIIDVRGIPFEEALKQIVPLLNDASHQYNCDELKSHELAETDDILSGLMPSLTFVTEASNNSDFLEKQLRKYFKDDPEYKRQTFIALFRNRFTYSLG